MTETQTLEGIHDEIQSLVSDKLQVVSYKWLSRNFLVSSNAAKRLLHEFVDKYGSGLEVVYSVSGWLKNDPSVYHIRLVSQPRLAEAKQEFVDDCSIQVYSVQACIPKDPATLWNAEFIQTEELFMQPPEVDNCLRDNRFCRVSNTFVKRSAGTMPTRTAAPLTKTAAAAAGPSREAATIPQPQQRKVQQLSPNNDLQSPSVNTGNQKQGSQPAKDEENVFEFPANKKKGQSDKNSSGTGGSLASMWGRASKKSKSNGASVETNNAVPNPTATAEGQICAHEAAGDGSSDDNSQDVNFKRAPNGESNRKRRVVLDYSDEEDEYKDTVSLASPDPPKEKSSNPKPDPKTSLVEKNKLKFEDKKEEPKVQKEKETVGNYKEESSALSKGKNSDISSSKDKILNSKKNTSRDDKAPDAGANSPKRRKVLKTSIDERGREVTEVVWEGDETDTKPDINTVKKVDNTLVNNPVNRPPASKKSPAIVNVAPNPASKAGSKKTGNKDPKQGNILSFFKRV